jgi:hypothetical protein
MPLLLIFVKTIAILTFVCDMQEDMSNESTADYYDIVKKTFASEDDGFKFYNSYALEKGFSVRKAMLSGMKLTRR